jgi:hypothetical protein
MTVFGWDASDYDWDRGHVDLQAASRDGILFFTHKSVETAPGQVFRHSHYGEALNQARAIADAKDGSLRYYGTYVVVRSGVTPEAQVANAVQYWDEVTPWWRTDPNFFIQVDLERWPYDSVAGDLGARLVRLFEELSPTSVLLYASAGQYGDTLPPDMLLWNANYAAENAPTRRYLDLYSHVGGDQGPGWAPYSGRSAAIWQFASDATIGSQPRCDANAFRGSADDFADLIKAPREDGGLSGEKPDVIAPPVFQPSPISRWSTVVLDSTGVKLAQVLSYYPQPADIYITSGTDGQHGKSSYHYGLLHYQGSPAAAVDVGFAAATQPARGRDLAKWLYDMFWDLIVELIHTTPFLDDDGFYVKDQVRYPGGGPYAGKVASQHTNHVHLASSVALIDQMLARLAGGTAPPMKPALRRPWPSYMHPGHYFGLISGPKESHGGFYVWERPDVQAIQRRLIELHMVPGVGDPESPWADGLFEQPTVEAVSRWQRAYYADSTTLFGQVWSDDWAHLFTY